MIQAASIKTLNFAKNNLKLASIKSSQDLLDFLL